MRTDQAPPVRLFDYRVPDHLIDTVALEVRLDRRATHVSATLAIRPNPEGGKDVPLVFDGEQLTLRGLRLDGEALPDDAWSATARQLIVLAPPTRPFTLQIDTEIDPTANLTLMGLYRSGSAYCTQCEAEGFRRITYFPDRPDVLSIYTVRIEADCADAPVLLSNGNCVETGVSEGSGRHFAVWHDPHPKPCYLFALVGGDLSVLRDDFVTASGRRVALAIYTEPGREARAGYAMDALKRSMRWDEEVFGREYDLDVFNIVAVSDFNMGAMENKGLNVFNDKYVLASPETATDGDYAGIETVIAHEYFHNWTGNRITCRDWFQLCLKEGLTVFRDHEFSADMRSRPVRRISEVRALRSAQFAEDAGPLAHNVRPDVYAEINNFYTATIYEKGSEVIRMLKVLIGDEAFRAGMDLYFERCDGTATTIEVFLECFADASGYDLGQFSLWYHQAGTPRLSISADWDEARGELRVRLAQTCPPTPGQPTKGELVIPLLLGLVAPDGGDAVLDMAGDPQPMDDPARGLFCLRSASRDLVFRNLREKPVVSALRGFSAPVVLDSAMSDADLVVLMGHDSDSFNRWQASQTLAVRLLAASTAAIREGRPPDVAPAFAAALGRTLDSASGDPAFAAQALSLPSVSDMMREIGRDVDTDAIHSAREALRSDLGIELGPRLRTLYESLADHAPYSPDAADAGRRSLRAATLDLFTAGDRLAGIELARRQYDGATNMTDRIAALAVLARAPGQARDDALSTFYDRFADDALVIDKWFALQAMQPDEGTLSNVRGLMAHPAFSITNPNRVRSLIGTFAGNPTCFNASDGSGFDFVADIVLELDPINAQVAARLLSSFKSWRSLQRSRGEKAEAALRRIAAATTLSPDVADIVGRSLA